MSSEPLALESVPEAVCWVVDTLETAGHEAFLVGGCVRDLLRGHEPTDFDVATSATAEETLGLFPRAVPIGLRHGTVMVPGPVGPVDVTRYRAGESLEQDLAHRDFTINALAYHPRRHELIDPFDGRADITKGRLRAVGAAEARFSEDPLRALRAARLHATLGLEVDAEVERAMGGAVEGLGGVARERVRRELSALMLAPGVAGGIELLRRSGIERSVAPGAAEDAPEVVSALPADLELRLAGWLRGSRAVSILRRLRFPRRSVERVELLLREHPVEKAVAPARDPSVRRFLRRVTESNVRPLLTLRRAELAVGAAAGEPDREEVLARLGEIEAALERVRRQGTLALQRHDLALDGREVMELLGTGPGPAVGRALRHLTECVVDDPACNTSEQLRRLLEAWIAAQQPAP